jgi:hypothetical protein
VGTEITHTREGRNSAVGWTRAGHFGRLAILCTVNIGKSAR